MRTFLTKLGTALCERAELNITLVQISKETLLECCGESSKKTLFYCVLNFREAWYKFFFELWKEIFGMRGEA